MSLGLNDGFQSVNRSITRFIEADRSREASPLADDPLREEANANDDMVIVEMPEPGSSGLVHVVESGFEEVGVTSGEDVDGTVGGKRKR